MSEETKLLVSITPLNKDLVHIIGELSGFELPLKKGDIFYEVESGGYTLVTPEPQDVRFMLGRNCFLHQYTVIRKTLKSYTLEYLRSTVIIYSKVLEDFYKFGFSFDHMKKYQKRVFPMRRKYEPDTQFVLKKVQCHVVLKARNIDYNKKHKIFYLQLPNRMLTSTSST